MKYSVFVSMGRLLLLAGAFVIVLSGGMAQAASIVGTKHDLKGAGYGTDQICIFCHTPHNALTPQLAPLWNHAETTQSFTLYASSSLNAHPGQPAGVSKACLSCHDGVTALDAYGAHGGTTPMAAGVNNLGTDLSNDHPVSFTYDAALVAADGGSGLATPQAGGAWVDSAHTVPLYSGQLECGSCHNVHDNANIPFLRKANTASALCLTCHTK